MDEFGKDPRRRLSSILFRRIRPNLPTCNSPSSSLSVVMTLVLLVFSLSAVSIHASRSDTPLHEPVHIPASQTISTTYALHSFPISHSASADGLDTHFIYILQDNSSLTGQTDSLCSGPSELRCRSPTRSDCSRHHAVVFRLQSRALPVRTTCCSGLSMSAFCIDLDLEPAQARGTFSL